MAGKKETKSERVAHDGFGDAGFVATRKPTISLATEGDRVAGYYVGSRVVRVQGRRSTLHRLIDADDTEIDLWGSAALDRELEAIAPGFLVRITMTGLKESGKGNPTKLFEVALAPQRATEERLAIALATMGAPVAVENGAAAHDDFASAFARSRD